MKKGLTYRKSVLYFSKKEGIDIYLLGGSYGLV